MRLVFCYEWTIINILLIFPLTMDLKGIERQAIMLIRQACSPYDILASSQDKENYRRLWARDSMIAGISGLLIGDEEILKGFRNSIQTLANYQHPHGMIPSNVQPDGADLKLSYGGLAGRVDATTWFVVGTCLYLLNRGDEEFDKNIQSHLIHALDVLDRWEFNGKGLIYTPLSGNWSDEYPVQGYTLYDNLLRLWGLKLYARLYNDEARCRQAQDIHEKIAVNYWPDLAQKGNPAIYHPREFEAEAENNYSHFATSIDPTGYNTHFDAAANGLALLLALTTEAQEKRIGEYAEGIFEDVGKPLIPAFWPVITPEDDKWHDLKNNYTYYFKNQAYHFQNGGIWPVWMGLFGMGFSRAGTPDMAETLLRAWLEAEDPEQIGFNEYLTSDTFKWSGKQRLSFSAAGLIFLTSSINKTYNQILYTD